MGSFALNEVRERWPGAPGFSVRLSESIRNIVVFLGHGSPTDPDAFEAVGTAFLCAYEGSGYLVTARHVASALSAAPFSVRLNKIFGGSHAIHADNVEWTYHPDATVDLAAIRFGMPAGHPFTAKYLNLAEYLIENPQHETETVGLGDQTYTVGLFRLLKGKTRNLPVVHTGNVALLPSDELIPMRDWDDPQRKQVRYVEGYLVECHGLDGLSGSPVFVRPPSIYRDATVNSQKQAVLWPQLQVNLLGVWQGAWDAPPDHVHGVGREPVRVSVGMGVVVPGSKIRDILELPDLKAFRQAERLLKETNSAASPELVEKPTDDPNPPHKEAFTSLLNAAARTKPQGD